MRNSDRFRLFVALVTMLFPQALKRAALRSLLGYSIHPTAKIGMSLIYPRQLYMGANSMIGSLSLCKGLSLMRIEEHGIVGNLNWITAAPLSAISFGRERDRMPSLILGDHAAITNRHLIDCTNAVSIGRYSTFAGFRSQILTHAINLEESRQESFSVSIGAYCFVGTSVVLLPGATLPNYSVLAASAILTQSYTEEYILYGGVPARPIKRLSPNLDYFSRSQGFVV